MLCLLERREDESLEIVEEWHDGGASFHSGLARRLFSFLVFLYFDTCDYSYRHALYAYTCSYNSVAIRLKGVKVK